MYEQVKSKSNITSTLGCSKKCIRCMSYLFSPWKCINDYKKIQYLLSTKKRLRACSPVGGFRKPTIFLEDTDFWWIIFSVQENENPPGTHCRESIEEIKFVEYNEFSWWLSKKRKFVLSRGI